MEQHIIRNCRCTWCRKCKKLIETSYVTSFSLFFSDLILVIQKRSTLFLLFLFWISAIRSGGPLVAGSPYKKILYTSILSRNWTNFVEISSVGESTWLMGLIRKFLISNHRWNFHHRMACTMWKNETFSLSHSVIKTEIYSHFFGKNFVKATFY